jgi:hypothetical protein
MQALVGLIDIKIEFTFIMLVLPVRRLVQMRKQNLNILMLKKIEDCEYTDQQIFNVDETGLFWKSMHSSAYVSKKGKTQPGFKVATDRLTLLLGGILKAILN